MIPRVVQAEVTARGQRGDAGTHTGEPLSANDLNIDGNGGQRIFGLDAIRALAAALVLFGHASIVFLPVTDTVDTWLVSTFFGVEWFFALSGFLIGGLLLDAIAAGTFDIRVFWMRRWLRTLPTYFLFLALNLIIYRAAIGQWFDAWAHAAFVQCFMWPCPTFFPESWSLALEEVFYLLAPALLLVFGARRYCGLRMLWLPGVLLIAITALRVAYVMAFDPSWDEGVRKLVGIRMDAFIFGIIAMIWHRHFTMTSARARCLLAVAAIGIGVAAAVYVNSDRDHDFFARTFLFSLVGTSLAATLPLAAHWRVSRLPDLVERAIRAMSRWSYSLYLCQLGVFRVLSWLIGWNATTLSGCLVEAIVFITLSILLAAFLSRFFERPVMSWRNRAWPTPTRVIEAA